jgi:hypothetical protein
MKQQRRKRKQNKKRRSENSLKRGTREGKFSALNLAMRLVSLFLIPADKWVIFKDNPLKRNIFFS